MREIITSGAVSVSVMNRLELRHCALRPEVVPLGPAALGLILAEDVISDLDMPPYDKALMDGFAVRSADLPDGHVEQVVGRLRHFLREFQPARPFGRPPGVRGDGR